MEFINRISHSLFFVTGADARKLRRLAVCALLAASAAGLAQIHLLWQPSQRHSQAEQSTALQGEAAIRRLKTDGGYASLSAALSAARYQINAASTQSGQASQSGQSGAPFYANNPGQHLRAIFAPNEIRVNATSNETAGKADGAELRLQLAGYGYGDQIEPLAAGVLTANGDRIEIKKSTIRNKPGPQSAITEWYVNKPEGLEQGFTLFAPPVRAKAGKWLRVALAVGEGWRASVRGDQQGALFERQADGLRLGYDHLAAYDAQGRALPARIELDGGAQALLPDGGAQALLPDGGTLSLLVDDTQAVYPLTIDPILTQQRKLTAADGAAGDQFGVAVALSGNTAVVGARFDDVTGVAQGSVYVFVRNGASWSQQQKLTAADGAAGDRFGVSVAISGDTIVVGASNDAISGNLGQGSAYIFIRSGVDWTQQQKLTPNDGAAIDNFGSAVALSGDTVVVSAAFDDNGENNDQGSAYVFTRSGVVWTQQQKLTATDGAVNDRFGSAVALDGDTVAVGVFKENDEQGSAYVFTRSGVAWTQQQKLTANDGESGDFFGFSVALSGDTAVVGARSDAIGANVSQGSAYVFTRSGAAWTQQQKLTANDGESGDFFGFSVALSGDTAVVGALNDVIGANANQGSAYVFSRNGVAWTQQQKLVTSDGAANDVFGVSVAVSGATVLVGAPNDDIGANSNQGSAYVFVICEDNHVQQQQLTANDGAADDGFGFSIALSGDTVVVGASFDDIGPNGNQGSAYIFTRTGAVWMLQQKLTATEGGAVDLFGVSVAISGDTVVVGAFGDDIGPNADQGSAYVFIRGSGVWTQQQKLTANDGAADDDFGVSVAVSGDTVVVGAFGDDAGANGDQGSAYVFARSGTVWTLQQKLTATDGEAGDLFGRSVAISGDTVVVGAFGDAIGANFIQGSAYVFTRNGSAWTQQQKLTADDGSAEDLFGFSIALSGDTAVVGAPFDVVGANASQGSAYVFTRSGAVWTQQKKLTPNDGTISHHFGFSVALSGATVVVGANIDDIGLNANQGSVYIFTRSGTIWTQQQRLIADDGAAGDGFGVSVALSGDTLVVGASIDDIGANANQGSAYVFVCPACPTITLDPDSLPGGVIGNSYSQTVTASGAAGPYQFSLSDGSLPPGLFLAQNGQISGTPIAAGVFRFTITATILSSLCSGSHSYTLTIEAPACQFSVAPANHAFSSNGGNGVVSVNAADGCAWTAAPNDSMITITSGANGNGSGTVRFAVSQNPNTGSRRGTLTIAGRRVTVVQAAPVACVSAASFIGNSLAAESIVAAFGIGLARSTEVASTQPLPSTLGGTRVSVLDSLGTERDASLFFISPTQINFEVPPDTAAGQALVTIIRDGETVAAESPQIVTVSPGLFSANASGQGLVIGFALRVKADGSQSFEPIVRFDDEKRKFVAAPIDLGPATDQVFLVMFGTGVRNRNALGAVSVKIGGASAEAVYAGPQGSFAGLDQLNVLLPRSLAGRNEVDVAVLVEGKQANALKVAIK